MQIVVPIGVLGRRVPGPIVFLSVLGGRVLIAVKHQPFHFADDIVVILYLKFL
jgi:hypothetical protein